MMKFQRVWSNIGSGAVKAEDPTSSEPESAASEAADRVTDLNSTASGLDNTPTSHITPWMRDVPPSGPTRHSRASSIVSTRTKYSTMTLQDDARSIDIHVGGQTFRIARDGSQITDAPPPPYSDPAESQFLRDGRPRASSHSGARTRHPSDLGASVLSFRGGRPGGSSVFDHHFGESEDESQGPGAKTPRQHSRASSSVSRPRANILDPSEVDMPSPVDADSQRLSAPSDGTETPSRNWSYKAGPDTITVASDARKLRTVSQNDLSPLTARTSSPLRRRNGVRLPTLMTESLNEAQRRGTTIDTSFTNARSTRSPLTIHSAGPVLYGGHSHLPPQSPTYIGRNARGIFPPVSEQKQPSLDLSIPLNQDASSSTSTGAHHSDGVDEGVLPLPMDTENDISLHYARLMRRLDRDHRKALHLKDKELEKLRERLNEVDIVYRQELKSRDFMIDDMKKRLDQLQERSETMLEKARNEVEDLWESRWKTQSNKLTERMKRIEEEAQKTIERLMAERKAAGESEGSP